MNIFMCSTTHHSLTHTGCCNVTNTDYLTAALIRDQIITSTQHTIYVAISVLLLEPCFSCCFSYDKGNVANFSVIFGLNLDF